MKKFLPDAGLMRTVSSALPVMRRQVSRFLATKRWDLVSRLLYATAFAAGIAFLLFSPAAHARSYDVFSADVPFKFYVGDRTFRPGHYEFIFVGPGLVAVRDGQKEVIASFVTREAAGAAPNQTKLTFTHKKDRPYLSSISIENRKQVLEVLGEQRATAPSTPSTVLPIGAYSFGGHSAGMRFKQ